MNREKIKELNKMMEENPEMDVTFCIYNTLHECDYYFYKAEMDKIEVEWYYQNDDRIFIGEDEIFSEIDRISFRDLTFDEMVKEYKITKKIIVWIV